MPDWPGNEFRLIRERSEQNRMHMPGGEGGGDYAVCIGGVGPDGGENGTTEILSPTRKSGHSLVLGPGAEEKRHGGQRLVREADRWTRGEEGVGVGNVVGRRTGRGGSTAKHPTTGKRRSARRGGCEPNKTGPGKRGMEGEARCQSERTGEESRAGLWAWTWAGVVLGRD